MNDQQDKKEQPEGGHLRLCQRTADPESVNKGLEREQTEKALRKSEERFSKAFNLNPSPMSITKVEDGRFLAVNESFLRVLGFKREEVIGLTPLELNLYVDPNERAKVLDTLDKEKRASQPEIEIRSKSGEVLIMRFAVEQLELDDEECIIATAVDITEGRLVEEALRESEERYSSLFKNNHSVMLLVDPESADIVDANPAACSFYGWSLEELTSKKITDINMLTSEQVFQEMERAKSEARNHFFFRHRLANKEIRDVEVYSGPISLHGEELLYSIIHDITERKRAEEEEKKLEGQLLQTKKLEAISTLSGGVAQELSNLFQAVHGYVERLMWGKEQDDPRYQELLEITNAAFRGAVLSKRLLAFSGIIESKKHPIDLSQEIEKVHKLLMRTMPETIKLELHLANEITIINGDPNQIEQALLALAVNARDAMPGGGKLTIETKKMILDEDFLRTHAGAAMGECALITVSDTGPGLGQKTLEHVFDPFYSKEDNSEKTGLGLSMVYGIVKNHGGYISCSSEPKVGTTFMIYLPVTEKET